MKRIAKRIISLLLAAVMVFGAAPLAGFVGLELPSLFDTKSEAATSGYYTYTVLNGEATITDCDESISGDITIPSTLGGYPVTSISDYAFCECTSLTSVTIGNSVTYIGDHAFDDCDSLTSVKIPDNVTRIGWGAFYNTGYYNNASNWKNDVLYIGKYLIEAKDTISGSYSIKEGTTVIADWAFQNCNSLTSATIGNSVTSIGESAFESCDSLTSVTIGNSVTSIGYEAFAYCYSLTSITIPDSVTSISNYAFYNTGYYCNASNWENDVLYIRKYLIDAQNTISGSYSIKEGTTVIVDYAFDDCDSLTSITIPDSVTSIGGGAFENCTSLERITIPDSVTSIGGGVFYECHSLTSVTIGNGVTSIGSYAFAYCDSLTSITIPDSVTSIGDWAFRDCENLEYIHIPSSVICIGNGILIDTSAYICSDTEDCYAKPYADENGIEFRLCDGNHSMTDDNDDLDETGKLQLISASPANNATAVSYTDSVVLTFNKNIKTYLLSGQSETDTEIAIRSYTTDEPIYSTYEMNPESFPIESGNQLIIPFALLKMIPGEKYYVYISPNSIRAADNFFGEKFEGITDKDAYTFSNFTPSITEGYSLDLFSANGNIEVKPGEEVSVAAILSLDGIPDNTNGITFTISDTSIAEITKIDKQSDRIVVFIKGNQQGITTLSVNADNADRNISAPVFVNDDKAVYYPSDLYKFDEDNPLITQGMFLTDFDFEENDNGETSAKFNVYNADCCTGIVDVYDSKGVCVESVLIDMFDGDYPTDIFDHMEYAGELIYNVFEIFDPDVIIQKAYTEKTSVSINIPHNGYITVTKDVAASDALLVYDVVTLSLEAISCASDVIDHFSAEEEEDVKKAVAEKILVKISETWLKKIRNSFIDYSTQNKSTDDFIYALFSDIDSALAESGDDFIDILTETAAETLPDVVFDDLKKHILKDFGIDIVDKIFYKSVKVVKWATIFNYISVYLMDESLVIYASQDGETKYSNGAKAQLSEDDENIVFHSVMITTGEKADALNVINEDTKLFEISLIKNGKVYDPYKTVAVYLPIPEGWDTENLTVYHLTDDYKTREKLDVVIENGYVKFETEGFSPFILANGELSFIDSISIKTPSTTTINYGDTLILHANIANIPNGTKIEWSVNGDGVSISPSEDGKTCAVTSKKSGDVTVSVKLVDNNGKVVKSLAGNELISEQKLKSNAGFFQKIISFFKNLFRINRTILQAFKNI